MGETNLSISDFIKWLISGQAPIDATKLKILALRGAALLLNMALGVVTGLVVSSLIGAITSYTQRIDTAATKTKEAADAANNTTSSLKDLVDAYKELGDKSGWSTEDFDQAKDIQEELLALAKEQGTLDENKANQLDLQNGKYEEQLGLLKDITEEQLKASESKLIQSKDAQGSKLIKTAKDNNRSHFFSSVSANTNRGIMNELKDTGIDVFNKNGSFGAKDLNDPDSIAKYYSELGRALDYIVQNTTEAQRAAGGAYNTVYKYLMDEQSALRDDVDSYNDSTDAVNENVNARRKLQAVDFWQNDNNNSMDVSFTFDKVNSAVQTLEDTIDGFDASKLNELLWGTNEGLSDNQAQALTNLRKALTDMDFSADTNGVNAFIQALVQVGIVAQSSANGVDALAAGAQKMEDISSKMDEIQSAYKASTSALEEYWLNSSVDSDTISFEQLTDAIKGYGTAMDEAKEKTDAIKSAFSGLSDVSKNKIDNPFGLLDSDDVEKKYQAIRDLYDNTDLFTNDKYAGALNPETGDIDYNSDAFKDMFLDSLDKMIAACKETGGAAGTYLAKGFEDAKNKIASNALSIEDYINGIGSTLSKINNSMDDYQSAFNDLSDIVDEYNAYGELSQDTIQKYMSLNPKYAACLKEEGGKLVFNKEAFRDLYIEQLKVLAETYKGTDLGDRYAEILEKVANGTWDVTDHMKGMGTEAQKLQSVISNLKDLFSSLLDIFNKLNDKKSNDLKIQGDAWIDVIDKRIDALNEQNDAQERAIELQKAEDALAKAQANKTTRVYGENGYEWEADASAVRDAQSDLSSKRREYKKQEEIDRLNKLKDKVQEATNLIGTSWDDYQKKLKYTSQFEAMTFAEMEGHYDGFMASVVSNMKAVQRATNVSNVITKLETLIDTDNKNSRKGAGLLPRPS